MAQYVHIVQAPQPIYIIVVKNNKINLKMKTNFFFKKSWLQIFKIKNSHYINIKNIFIKKTLCKPKIKKYLQNKMNYNYLLWNLNFYNINF